MLWRVRPAAVLEIETDIAGADAAELDRASARLRQELLLLDIDDVRRVHEGAPPPGARAVDIVALGALLVNLGPTAGALNSVLHALKDWVGRSSDRKVVIKIDDDQIELSNATAEQQQVLINSFLSRHPQGQ
jgi:hypothetical protein